MTNPNQAAQQEESSSKQVVVQEESVKTMNFSLQIAKHVILENIDDNKSVVCSPASIDAILRILAVGAENSTLAQLLELLGHADVRELNEAASKLAGVFKISDGGKDKPMISFANALWLDQRFSLKPEFQRVSKDVHNAQVMVVDFVNKADEVVKEANSWAEQQTKGLIKDILARSDINDETPLLLANALYFKGTWQNTFKESNTQDGGFNLLDGHKVRVPFMWQGYKNFDYGTFKENKVIRMPYKRGYYSDDNPKKTFSMYIFLPYEKDGLPNLMENIVIDENMFKDQVKLKNVTVDKLKIPKFKFESHVNLKDTMRQLGLTLPFEEKCEDFSGIIDNPVPIYVSDIVQKCFIETNEEGTEAAAFTRGRMACGGMPPPGVEFVAKHPFMFMIREDVSGTTLFVGTVLNPK